MNEKKDIIMRNKWIVYILVLTVSISPFTVNTSTAGGGGSCSGEDEEQCLAVVFGTAAIIITGVYLVSRYAEAKKTETPEKQSLVEEPLSTKYDIDLLEEKQVITSTFQIEDLVTQRGDLIIWKW